MFVKTFNLLGPFKVGFKTSGIDEIAECSSELAHMATQSLRKLPSNEPEFFEE